MRGFFDYLPNDYQEYKALGYENELNLWGHIAPFILTVVCIIFVYHNRKKILNWKYENILRYVIAGLLVFGVLSYRIYVIYYKQFDVFYDLPFHISNVTAFMLAYALVTKKRIVAEMFFSWAIISGLAAMVYPDTLYVQFDHFLYYQLMGTHSIILFVPFYFMYVYNWKATKKTFVRSILALYAYAIISGILNIIFDTNYALSNPNYPAVGTPLVTISDFSNGSLLSYLVLSFLLLAVLVLIINFILVLCSINIEIAPYE
ncbi:YwaF family protein [Mycoplasmatota bacterium WC44]